MNEGTQNDRTRNLSVVLPAYNEKENLAVLIPDIERTFEAALFEIIVVDDGSKDGTRELLESLNTQYGNVRPLYRASLMGIGSALRDGYNAAKGEYILSSDADLSFSTGDMRRLYEKIQEGYDFVTGYRHGEGAYYESKAFAIRVKHLVSRLGNTAVRLLSGIRVRDFSANFRIIRRAKWRELETEENTNTLLFEMILKATKKGFHITEIPVSFYERKYGESKLNLWKEAPKFLLKSFKYFFSR